MIEARLVRRIDNKGRVPELEFDPKKARIIVREEIESLLKRQAEARAKLEMQTVEYIQERLRRMHLLADKPKELLSFIRSPMADKDILDLRIFNEDEITVEDSKPFKKIIRLKASRKKK